MFKVNSDGSISPSCNEIYCECPVKSIQKSVYVKGCGVCDGLNYHHSDNKLCQSRGMLCIWSLPSTCDALAEVSTGGQCLLDTKRLFVWLCVLSNHRNSSLMLSMVLWETKTFYVSHLLVFLLDSQKAYRRCYCSVVEHMLYPGSEGPGSASIRAEFCNLGEPLPISLKNVELDGWIIWLNIKAASSISYVLFQVQDSIFFVVFRKKCV